MVDENTAPLADTPAQGADAPPAPAPSRGRTKVIDAAPSDARDATPGGTGLSADAAAMLAENPDSDLSVDTTLDPDLAPLADSVPAQNPLRVTSVDRRRPQTVGVKFLGRHRGKGLSEVNATVIVPDEDNDEKVDGLRVAAEDALGPRAGEHIVSGPTYQFTRGEVTQVDPEDVPYLVEQHPLWNFEVVK